MPTLTTKTEVNIDIEVTCDTCGGYLTDKASIKILKDGTPEIYIKPCRSCLETQYEEGYRDGES